MIMGQDLNDIERMYDTLMLIQDRTNEHAVLQKLGYSGPRVFRLVLAESVLLSFAGGILGVGAALFVLPWTNPAVGAEAVTVDFQPSLHGP